MEKLSIVKTGTDLFNIDNLRSAFETAASSPKVAAGVAASTATMGAMAKLELLQSGLGTLSLLIGTLTGCVVLAIQTIKLIRVYRSFARSMRPHKAKP